MLFGLGKNKGKGDKSNGNASQSSAGQSAKGKATGKKSRARSKAGGLERSGVRKPRLRGAVALSGGVNKLFHGVAIRSRGDACCQAVEALGTQRFLSEDAPLLPLAECSNPQGCRCVYEHFDERRDNLRRGTDVGLPERLYPDEKRDGHGRRITDG